MTLEHMTDATACAGVTSPLWLTSIPADLQVALMGLSIVWIVMQITFKIQDRYRKKRTK
jgi:hypothetical protein